VANLALAFSQTVHPTFANIRSSSSKPKLVLQHIATLQNSAAAANLIFIETRLLEF
jgi:hypothetical protein